VLAAAALAAGSAGCETFGPHSCDTSLEANPAVYYTGGSVQDGVYFSSQEPAGAGTTSPWGWELLWFPGGARYSLAHGLGATPRWILSYLSFDMYGTADGGTIAQSAGNEVEILSVDDQTIQVQNTNCADYYLLVAAGVGAAQPSPP
jgi:hypothetical protein